MADLTTEQLERYSRQIALGDVGVAGQQKLLAGKVLIVGVGGLGSPAALYLAAAGVGTIGLIDGDPVDLTNLQRQVIHHTPDIGMPKVESAAAKMRAINPGITINTYNQPAGLGNIESLMGEYDFVIDGTDNFPAKFLVNDAAVLTGTPFSHAGVLRFAGQAMTVIPGQSACVRCVFGGPPPPGSSPSCSYAGILGVVPGIVGTIQAAEAVRFVLGIGKLLADRIVSCDTMTMRFSTLNVKRDPACPVCGGEPVIKTLEDGVKLDAAESCRDRQKESEA